MILCLLGQSAGMSLAATGAVDPGKQAGCTNRLADATSPYLLQHAGNPICWYPWGDEAFAAARAQNKPIFLSIGYSSCYWCHFMEEDSFAKQDVADLLNAGFIAIKVDREELPAVDLLYRNVLLSMTGSAGWPMSLFLTPEGKPFVGASTIRHDRFISILKEIGNGWRENPARFLAEAEEEHRSSREMFALDEKSGPVQADALLALRREAVVRYDQFHGGFGSGTKFPNPHLLLTLLRVQRRSGDPVELSAAINGTLAAMVRGGIHDLLGGGFHRYTVDRAWNIPHFEKMLYDNAGLAELYLAAFQATGKEDYAFVARRTLDWLLREMTDSAGGFYSSMDAGEYGREGEFYVWREQELRQLLDGDELAHLRGLMLFSSPGNFEQGINVLRVSPGKSLPREDQDPLYGKLRDKLLTARATREPPRLDDKILTAWNGLTVAALARGARVLSEPRYLLAAQRSAHFIRSRMTLGDGRLMRSWRQGKLGGRAVLNDYAYLIHGLLELYQADFDPQWFDWAVRLQKIQDQDFLDADVGGYFFDDGRDQALLKRLKEYDDQMLPSGNGMAALNLLRLADFTYEPGYRMQAERLLGDAAGRLMRWPMAHGQLLAAVDALLDKGKEVAIVGGRRQQGTGKLLEVINRRYLPNVVVAYSEGGEPPAGLNLLRHKDVAELPTAYVCEQGLCRLPVTEPEPLLRQLESFVPLP